MKKSPDYVAKYTAVFSTGAFAHRVELFYSYSDDNGVEGEAVYQFESTRAVDVQRQAFVKLNDAQKKKLRDLMTQRSDGTVLWDGKYKKN